MSKSADSHGSGAADATSPSSTTPKKQMCRRISFIPKHGENIHSVKENAECSTDSRPVQRGPASAGEAHDPPRERCLPGNSYSAPRNAKRSKKRADRTQMRGLICRIFPVPILMKVNESRPRLNPVAILKVSGVAIDVINAGNASVKSFQSTLASEAHISAPTRISAGAVA